MKATVRKQLLLAERAAKTARTHLYEAYLRDQSVRVQLRHLEACQLVERIHELLLSEQDEPRPGQEGAGA